MTIAPAPVNTPHQQQTSTGSALTNIKSMMTNAMNQVAQGATNATSNIPTFQSHISDFTSQLSLDESKK